MVLRLPRDWYNDLLDYTQSFGSNICQRLIPRACEVKHILSPETNDKIALSRAHPRPDQHPQGSFQSSRCHGKHSLDNAPAELEKIARGFISAINRRVLSSTAAEWQPISPNFRASFDQEPDQLLNREEYLRWLGKITKMNPNHVIRVLDVATYVDSENRRAEVWMTGTTSDAVHEDLVHQCVKVLDFALSQEHGWLCVTYKRLRGPLGADVVF
ncbi:hypothetical protein PRZ48_002000 [Zasmidium cellare]|uniref:Uncharacterized protein n=1 Tax=Zasmidium cellare TaxID=395010 RepID=A0ABR0F316_ZASCE|nr:hypothetical protein PRZ48_002000 [Zasmidium cellare]